MAATDVLNIQIHSANASLPITASRLGQVGRPLVANVSLAITGGRIAAVNNVFVDATLAITINRTGNVAWTTSDIALLSIIAAPSGTVTWQAHMNVSLPITASPTTSSFQALLANTSLPITAAALIGWKTSFDTSLSITSTAFIGPIGLQSVDTSLSITATPTSGVKWKANYNTALSILAGSIDTLNLAGSFQSSLASTASSTGANSAGLIRGITASLPLSIAQQGLDIVAYDATGAGVQTTGTTTTSTYSWSQTVNAGDTALIAPFSLNQSPAAADTLTSITATYAGVTLTLLGTQIFPGSTFGFTRTMMFGLLQPPVGTANVVVTVIFTSATTLYGQGNSASYSNVAAFGPCITNSGTTSVGNQNLSLSVSAPANGRIAQVFALQTPNSADTIGSYNRTSRWSVPVSGSTGTYYAVVFGDAAGGGTISFTGTAPGTGDAWTALGVPLIPFGPNINLGAHTDVTLPIAASPSANSARVLNFSASLQASASPAVVYDTMQMEEPVFLTLASAGGTSATSPFSFTDIIPANTTAALIWVANASTAATPTISLTIGGVSAFLLQTVFADQGSVGYTYLNVFALFFPPTGSQTITWTTTTPSRASISPVYYGSVSDFGAITFLSNQAASATFSMSATNTDKTYWYANAFGCQTLSASSLISYSQRQRFTATEGTKAISMVDGDAVGTGGTITFSCTANTTQAWAGMIVPLIADFPPVATLIDDFLFMDTIVWNWTRATPTPTIVSGQISIVPGAGFPGIQAKTNWNLTGSSIYIGLITQMPTGTDSPSFGLTDASFTNRFYISVASGVITASQQTASGTTNSSGVAFDPVNDAWWRIRENSGTIYFELSPDANIWSTLWSVVWTVDQITGLYPYAIVSGSGTTPWKFGGVNTPSVGTSLSTTIGTTASITVNLPLTSSIVDNFHTDSSIKSNLWIINGTPTPTIAGGGLSILPGSAYPAIFSITLCNFQGSSFSAGPITQIPTTSDAVNMGLFDSGEQNGFMYQLTGGNLISFQWLAGTPNVVASTTFNLSTMSWWRMRESGGVVFFDTSSDGVTWNNHSSITWTVPQITQLNLFFACGGTSTTAFIIDGCNTTGSQHTADVSLVSITAGTTDTVTYQAVANASLAITEAASATPPNAYTATANLALTSSTSASVYRSQSMAASLATTISPVATIITGSGSIFTFTFPTTF